MRKGLSWFILVLVIFSCDSFTKRQELPGEVLPPVEVPPSLMGFQVNLSASELEEGLNEVLPYLLIDDAIALKDPSDTLYLKLVRRNTIDITIKDGVIMSSIPLDVAVAVKKKVLGVTFSNQDTPVHFSGTVRANAQLRLGDDWEMDIVCGWEGFDWNDQPRLTLAGLSVDISRSVERFFEEHTDVLSNVLCNAIQESFSFRQLLTRLWEEGQDPIRIRTSGESLWMHSHPIGLAGEIANKDDTLSINLELRTKINISNRQVINARPQELMARSASLNSGARFLAYPEFLIPYELMTRLLQGELLGNELNYNGYSATVQEVAVSPEGQLLNVRLKLSGDLNGDLNIKGRPKLQKDMILVLEEFEFEIKSDDELMGFTDLLFHEIIEEYIITQLYWNVGPTYDRLDEEIRKAVERTPVGNKLTLDIGFYRLKSYQLTMTDYGVQWIFQLEGRSFVHLQRGVFQNRDR